MNQISKWEVKVRELEASIIEYRNSLSTLKSLWYVPEENAEAGKYNGVLFLGLNSGGETIYQDRFYSVDEKVKISYYHDDLWTGSTKKGESPLQLQVRLLFLYILKHINGEYLNYDYSKSMTENIKEIESTSEFKEYIGGVLAGDVSPFQSSSAYTMLYQWFLQENLLIDFWSQILIKELRGETKYIFVMGDETFSVMTKVYDYKAKDIRGMRTGWGNTTFSIANKDNCPIIVRLPHLSRYKIFGRKESEMYIYNLFKTIGESYFES